MVHATREYSTKPGDSVYPVERGYIIKLTPPQFIRNWKVNRRLAHHVFIWVLRVHKSLKPGQRHRDRKVNIYIFKTPTEKEHRWQYQAWQKTVTIGYLQKIMADGYEIVTKRCLWNYKPEEAKKFYRAIGLTK